MPSLGIYLSRSLCFILNVLLPSSYQSNHPASTFRMIWIHFISLEEKYYWSDYQRLSLFFSLSFPIPLHKPTRRYIVNLPLPLGAFSSFSLSSPVPETPRCHIILNLMKNWDCGAIVFENSQTWQPCLWGAIPTDSYLPTDEDLPLCSLLEQRPFISGYSTKRESNRKKKIKNKR